MKIVIPGGSGQIGALLARVFVARGDEVVILARTPKVYAQKQLKSVAWDGRTLGARASDCPHLRRCSRSVRFSCAPKPNSFSRVAEWCLRA